MLRCVLEEVRAEVSKFADSADANFLYSDEPPVLRATSPLAEGTDRMFAEEAIALGFKVLCPMPFSQVEFEKDFLPPNTLEEHSRDRFRGLLKQASENAGLTTFELDGERSAAQAAYGAAGRVVLNQSDLLVAVWDGGKPAGGGGTVETIRDAVHFHVPVLWIDAMAPHRWQLILHADDLNCREGESPCAPKGEHTRDPAKIRLALSRAIKIIVAEELGLPESRPEGDRASTTISHAAGYFLERKPRFNFAFVWKLFRDAVSKGAFRIPKILVPEFEIRIRKGWPILDDFKT
jgi:hypothetical protein